MGAAISCCEAKRLQKPCYGPVLDETSNDCLSGGGATPSTQPSPSPNAAMSPSWDRMSSRVPHDPEHELEWSIVADSIEEEELFKIREMHQILQDCELHPTCRRRPLHRQAQTLLRFLRARDGDVLKAERMFRDMLEWRHDFDVEGKVHSWRRELERNRTRRARLCKRFGIEEQICNDKYGIPVRLIRLGVADSAGMIREFGQEAVLVDSLSKLEWTHEQIRKAMFKHRKLIRGQLQILDVGDYGDVPNWTGRMWNNLRLGPDIYKVFDGNYPETVRKVFIVRTSSLVHHGYVLVQKLLPQRTKRKLKLFGPKAAEWVPELRSELQEQQELPEFLLCDSERAFRSATPRGGVVPEGIAGADEGRFEEDDEAAPVAPNFVAHAEDKLAQKSDKVWSGDALLRFLLAVVFALAAAVLGGQLAKDGF
mmetsp:Transcript_16620/g.31427  ORF Transcript_16620/g.31427 Transcript_16620/m.31427 type:complete len:424 (-) Transcript_16620:148-1419(-)